ncbi:hypothetical protein BGZ65_007276 [Modicella reniformis]|uniref:HTH psq-type domain-containing protein n=1 Tax=Modicella reniformis TaxID=1440133 RepID=A0A9P6M881_9FUNG|nr:hypothetical protein BGZ65_007276 [Modicella reniformis]
MAQVENPEMDTDNSSTLPCLADPSTTRNELHSQGHALPGNTGFPIQAAYFTPQSAEIGATSGEQYVFDPSILQLSVNSPYASGPTSTDPMPEYVDSLLLQQHHLSLDRLFVHPKFLPLTTDPQQIFMMQQMIQQQRLEITQLQRRLQNALLQQWQWPNPTTRRGNREEDEHQIGEDTNNQSKVKRSRNPPTVQQKLKIIAYREENPNKSMTEIGRRFGVPRSTVYGIIRDKDILKQPELRAHSFVLYCTDITAQEHSTFCPNHL